MKKRVYQRPSMRIIPILPGELLIDFSVDTGDFLSRKKELDLDWQEEEEEEETHNRFGYWG
ncbi:MAG: hypothetical protein IJS43_03580 [Bacteroidaceae bacterium]|nr:hypothetical protein [Bacteroidaceae bacterium]